MDPNVRKSRVRAAFHVRACAAALCVGAQIVAMGTGAAMTLCLNAAWLSALGALPACALVAALCRRRLVAELSGGRISRIQRLLAAVSLLSCCALSLSALLSLAEQTFLSQARTVFILAVVLVFLLLCALGGEAGAARGAFSLRYAAFLLPALLLLQAALSREAGGLFPLLGTGGVTLGLSAAAMLSCAAPALLLALPPDVGELSADDVPGTGFFLWRVLAGAAAGILLLLAVTLGTTYETIAADSAWGQRLRLTGAGGKDGGLLFSFLTIIQLALFLLCAANTLLASERALAQAFPALSRMRAGLAILLVILAAAMTGLVFFGMDIALAVGSAAIIPAAAALFWRQRRS